MLLPGGNRDEPDPREKDARRMRRERAFIFANLKTGAGAERIADFIVAQGGLDAIR
jgi:Ni2+-binding GTPase involved in maturation of urease and hydrogenase